jgi:hypothetical protein
LGGTAAGIVTGMEAAADSAVANGEGFAAGITAGRKAVHEFGGFKDHKRNNKDNPVNAPSNFANSYASRTGTPLSAPSDGGTIDVNTPEGESDATPELDPAAIGAGLAGAAVVGSMVAGGPDEEQGELPAGAGKDPHFPGISQKNSEDRDSGHAAVDDLLRNERDSSGGC